MIVIHNTKTGRFRAAPGLCRGWTDALHLARFYASPEEGFEDTPLEDREGCKPLYVYLHEEPLTELE